jgi:hypothetical protein
MTELNMRVLLWDGQWVDSSTSSTSILLLVPLHLRSGSFHADAGSGNHMLLFTNKKNFRLVAVLYVPEYKMGIFS